ncbi:MAG: hypothetical protein ACT4O2_02080 [Beijerinckiaceae bacterium]
MFARRLGVENALREHLPIAEGVNHVAEVLGFRDTQHGRSCLDLRALEFEVVGTRRVVIEKYLLYDRRVSRRLLIFLRVRLESS